MTKILSIDLGQFKSVACLYQQKAQPVFRTFATTPAALHDLLVELEPDRVVIEVCGIAGWIHDLCVSLDLPIAVVDTRHEARRWNKVKHKTDRGDALKLARLAAADDISTVNRTPTHEAADGQTNETDEQRDDDRPRMSNGRGARPTRCVRQARARLIALGIARRTGPAETGDSEM